MTKAAESRDTPRLDEHGGCRGGQGLLHDAQQHTVSPVRGRLRTWASPHAPSASMAALHTGTLRTPAAQAASSAAAAAAASPACRQHVSSALWQNAAGTRSAT